MRTSGIRLGGAGPSFRGGGGGGARSQNCGKIGEVVSSTAEANGDHIGIIGELLSVT